MSAPRSGVTKVCGDMAAAFFEGRGTVGAPGKAGGRRMGGLRGAGSKAPKAA
jgi:hypothetical protein